MPAKLRVGIVDFLNSKPLAWAFQRGVFEDRFDPCYHRPSTVARLMAEGALDIGLLPSIEVARSNSLSILPGLCVASVHEVRSVILVARCDLRDIRRVALDTSSRTSSVLVQILFKDLWKSEPEFVDHAPDLESMLVEADAALLIGDPALRVDPDRYQIHDLAAAWKHLTGLPFVFAVWAVASRVAESNLSQPFLQSLALARQEFDRLVRESAEDLGLEPLEIRSYLTQNLKFELGPREKQGLEEFFRRAHHHGLLHEPPVLRWFDSAIHTVA